MRFPFCRLQGRKAFSRFPVSDNKQAAPSEMHWSCLMSSEDGFAFPLNGLSVFDMGPLAPTDRAVNTAAILCADVKSPRHQGGPPDPHRRSFTTGSAKPAPTLLSATRVAACVH